MDPRRLGENIARYAPHFKDVGYFFKGYLNRYLTADTLRLLDIGCGHQALGQEFYQRAKWRVGVDLDKAALDANKLMNEKFFLSIERLPNFPEKFDVIIAQWVLEHLQNPEAAVRRISELCKPGGYFIFMTTNIYSPLVFLSKITPTFFKKLIKKLFLAIPPEDTHRTAYLINSVGKIDYYFTRHGFQEIEVKRVGVLTYFAFSRPVLKVKIFLDRIFDRFGFLDAFKTHIVGVYRKL